MKSIRSFKLVDYVKARKYCSLAELMEAFHVSSATIHRDVVRHVLVQRIVAAYDKYEKSRLPDDHARKFTQKPQTKRNLK